MHILSQQNRMNTTSCFSFQSEMAQQTCNAYAKEKKEQMIYIYIDIHMEHAHHIPVVSYNMHIYRKTACTT